MPIAEYIWFCECCGAEHREEMTDCDESGWVHRDQAWALGWREVSDGTRLIECCPDCMRTEYWKIAAGQHKR